MSTTAAPPRISERDHEELVGLIEQADTVELKLTLPESTQRSAAQALGLDPLDAQIRQVFFFDTPELDLYDHGVVARARRVQGEGGDSVVKLRPVVPDELPAKLRKSPTFGVEVDAMPGGFVCSGSMKGELGPKAVLAAVQGERPLRKLFSKEQRALFAEYAPDGIEIDDLSVLGPVFVLKLKSYPTGFKRKLVTEAWLYPNGSRVFELSTKCKPKKAFQAAAEARAFFTERGVSLSGEQQPKTRKALEFFSRELGG